MNTKETKQNIIKAGRRAIEELIKVAEEPIIGGGEEDLSADKLKNAAATKRLAIFDAFEILTKIDQEEASIDGKEVEDQSKSFGGFAERRSRM